MYKYIDIGLNLFSEQFAGREDETVRRAAEKEVGIIITGSSERSSRRASEYVQGREGIYATAGVHPHDAKSWNDTTAGKQRKMLKSSANMVAVGECGLDYDRMFSPKEKQLYVFEEQIKLAEELGLPLFLHEREATEDFADILGKHRDICKRAVVHCFTGSKAAALKYLKLGCMIGITGWVCDDRRNQQLLDALDIIPPERLMAETDGPYLLPRGIKGLKNPNVSENIVYVVGKLADVKGMDEEELRQILLSNTRSFFGV